MNYPIWLCVSFFGRSRNSIRKTRICNYSAGETTGPDLVRILPSSSCVCLPEDEAKDFAFRHSNRIEKRARIWGKSKICGYFPLAVFVLCTFAGYILLLCAAHTSGMKMIAHLEKIIVNKASKEKFFLATIGGFYFGRRCVFMMLVSWVQHLSRMNRTYRSNTFPDWGSQLWHCSPVAKKLGEDTKMRKSCSELRTNITLQNE